MTESRSNIGWVYVSLAGYRGVHLILASSCIQCQRSRSNNGVLSSSFAFKSFSSHYLLLSSMPPATRCCEEQRQTITRAKLLSSCVLSPGAGRKTHALLCWTRTPRGPGSKHPESGVSGWRDFLSLSSYSTAPVCSIIQAGLNPSSLYPPHSFSIHPSLSFSH